MKVLAIIGSPRKKGNSFQAAREVEKQMKQWSNVDFEYLYLKDANLEMCSGCFNCLSRGEDYCPHKDDRAEIEQKMMDVDGVIFVSPCYCLNVSALMKNFIDRFAYIFHRPRFFNQNAMILSTTAGSGLKETLKYMENLGGWGFGSITSLGLITPPWPHNDGLKIKNQRKIVDSSKKFFQSLQNEKRPSPSFNQYIQFRFMKFASDLKEYLPADNEFYKNKKEYFYPTKINPLKKYSASIIMKIALFFMKDMEPGK